MRSEILWLNNYVSPYLLSVFVGCAIDLNWVTAYLFVASFLAWLVLISLYAGLIIYERGVLVQAWRLVQDYARHVADRLNAMRHFYLMKSVGGLLILYLLSSCVLWLINFDIWHFVSSTLQFIRELPALLMDTHALILAIQAWLNRVLLAGMINMMAIGWTWQKNLLCQSPWLGALSILCTLGVVTIFLEIGCWMAKIRPYWRRFW